MSLSTSFTTFPYFSLKLVFWQNEVSDPRIWTEYVWTKLKKKKKTFDGPLI